MSIPRRDTDAEYEPFPNEEGRNARQQNLEVPALVRALALPEGARMLEVGCGRGIALPALARLCHPRSLVGLDIEADLLTEAQGNLGGAEAMLVRGDVRSLPFPANSFDIVIDFGTLYHIARPAEGLHEVARVMDTGSIFIEETRVSQLLSHPSRSWGRAVPWPAEPVLYLDRWAGLWASYRKVADNVRHAQRPRWGPNLRPTAQKRLQS
jgi:ubiquinone/menaquinone biosynthesis C-methylase UbiE